MKFLSDEKRESASVTGSNFRDNVSRSYVRMFSLS